MNSWSFSGNLGQDAETRFTQAGEAVVSFSVGVKSGYGDKASTTWARCSMFGKRGEAVSQYLAKGQLVGIVGEVIGFVPVVLPAYALPPHILPAL